jgi:hypothetical protein
MRTETVYADPTSDNGDDVWEGIAVASMCHLSSTNVRIINTFHAIKWINQLEPNPSAFTGFGI